MSAIILTGIRHGKHQFTLDYPVVNGQKMCMAHCECGYEVEILYFKNYGGVKYLQKMWELVLSPLATYILLQLASILLR